MGNPKARPLKENEREREKVVEGRPRKETPRESDVTNEKVLSEKGLDTNDAVKC